MDEKDVKMANLRAQIEGQEKTIKELTDKIGEMAAEITRLRKRDVEMTQLFEELRDKHTGLIGGIMELKAKLESEIGR